MIITSINELLYFFEVTKKQLNFLSFGSNNGKIKLYQKYEIPKINNKIRVLHEPVDKLKEIQHSILYNILLEYWEDNVPSGVKKCSVGFLKGKSIIDNTKPHINKDIIIKFDLKNYFPSIGQNRIFGMFQKRFGFNYEISNYLSGLCSFENELPQGAPTSPMIANIISINLDIRINKYIKTIRKNNKIKINYTRYADDISISLNGGNDYLIDFISNRIFDIIEEENFMVNYSKFRIMKKNRCQKITGIVVNKKLSVGRKKFKWLKGIVHNINTSGWDAELLKWNDLKGDNIRIDEFQSVIKGYISYFEMINGYIYSKHLILNK